MEITPGGELPVLLFCRPQIFSVHFSDNYINLCCRLSARVSAQNSIPISGQEQGYIDTGRKKGLQGIHEIRTVEMAPILPALKFWNSGRSEIQ